MYMTALYAPTSDKDNIETVVFGFNDQVGIINKDDDNFTETLSAWDYPFDGSDRSVIEMELATDQWSWSVVMVRADDGRWLQPDELYGQFYDNDRSLTRIRTALSEAAPDGVISDDDMSVVMDRIKDSVSSIELTAA